MTLTRPGRPRAAGGPAAAGCRTQWKWPHVLTESDGPMVSLPPVPPRRRPLSLSHGEPSLSSNLIISDHLPVTRTGGVAIIVSELAAEARATEGP